jgi:hypothetical protein
VSASSGTGLHHTANHCEADLLRSAAEIGFLMGILGTYELIIGSFAVQHKPLIFVREQYILVVNLSIQSASDL